MFKVAILKFSFDLVEFISFYWSALIRSVYLDFLTLSVFHLQLLGPIEYSTNTQRILDEEFFFTGEEFLTLILSNFNIFCESKFTSQ